MGTPGPAVGWSEVKGIGCSMEFARQAFHADLLVLGQRDPSAPAGASGDFNETVMLASGKPTLVMPYGAGMRGTRVQVVVPCATPSTPHVLT